MTDDLIQLNGAHATVLAALHLRCFAEPWEDRAMAGLLAMPGVFGFLAIDAGSTPIGMVLFRLAATEAEILTLLVIPEARRRGWGARLLAQARASAASRGASVMFLEVAATNQAALTLYTASGFSPVGRRPRYYADGGDALVLRAFLTRNR